MAEDTTSFEDDQCAFMSTEDIQRTSCLLDNEIRILKEELQRTNLELDSFKENIKDNQEKIKLNKQFPYLVGNICCRYRRTVVTPRVNTASYMVTTA
ncbi:26S proteasome regulatory subunit 6A [Tanacetum coccineum]